MTTIFDKTNQHILEQYVINKDKMKSCILILFIISFFLDESHQLFSSPAMQREMKKRCPDFRQRAEAEKRVWDCLQEEKLETYRRRRTTYDQVRDNCVFDSPHILGKNTSTTYSIYDSFTFLAELICVQKRKPCVSEETIKTEFIKAIKKNTGKDLGELLRECQEILVPYVDQDY